MRVLQVSYNFAVRTPLQQLKQARFFWPFNSWLATAILLIFIVTSVESPNPSQRQCPTLTGKHRNSKSLNNCFKKFLKHNQLTEEGKLKYFQSLMSDDALKTFKTSPALTGKT